MLRRGRKRGRGERAQRVQRSPRGFPSGPIEFGAWLYIRVSAVSEFGIKSVQNGELRGGRRGEDAPAGCITAHTHKPENVELKKNFPIPSLTPHFSR